MTTQAESGAAASGPDHPVVLYRRDGDITVITLNRPE
jgi:hypothetical protein